MIKVIKICSFVLLILNLINSVITWNDMKNTGVIKAQSEAEFVNSIKESINKKDVSEISLNYCDGPASSMNSLKIAEIIVNYGIEGEVDFVESDYKSAYIFYPKGGDPNNYQFTRRILVSRNQDNGLLCFGLPHG